MKTVTAHKIRVKTLEGQVAYLQKRERFLLNIIQDLVRVMSIPAQALEPGEFLRAREAGAEVLENNFLDWEFGE